ncbi:Crp/Fnr family transcriptional regulator [[Pantoea] beijingensis]|uniref:Crp/Fnr family transcriptional regulator n=1 Tax=[Pantoea] beijingensis TaxID=1324864 RepID=UPI001E61920E|nr:MULTISPECIES: Crp/Fnr family transcriptional regulator [Erwiniaceae]
MNPGEYLLRQGEEISALYWITLGEYSLHHHAENGKVFSLGQRFVSDTLIGEIEYLTNTPSQFSVVAHDAITVDVIPPALMQTILSSHAEVGIWLSQRLSQNYQGGMAKTMERFLQPLHFTILADIYQRYLQGKPLVDFTQVYREAERFGCSERAYRRVITQLLNDRYIQKLSGVYTVCDMDKFHRTLTVTARSG